MEASLLQRIFSWCARHPARAGSLAGLFQQACTIGVAVILIPVTTSFLTPAEAGLWFAFQGMVAMVSMIDLGFGFAISRQAAFTLGSKTDHQASDDFIKLASGQTGIHQLYTLTKNLYLCMAALGATVSLVAYEIFSTHGNLIATDNSDVRIAWYAISTSCVIMISGGGFAAFLNGVGGVYQSRILAGLYQLVAGLGAGLAVWMGGQLPVMAFCYTICSIVYWIALRFTLRRNIPPISKKISPPPRSFRQLARAAIPIGIVNIFGSFVYMVQPALLGILMGPDKVAPFYLAQKIGLAFNMIPMQLALPQTPFFTRLLGSNDYKGALSNFKRITTRTSTLVIITSLSFYLTSPWMAQVLLHKSDYVSPTTLGIMTIDFCILGLTVTGGHYVLASGRNPFAASTILTGLLSLLLTFILTPHLGITALPVSTLTAGLLGNYRKCLLESRSLKHSLKEKATNSPRHGDI